MRAEHDWDYFDDDGNACCLHCPAKWPRNDDTEPPGPCGDRMTFRAYMDNCVLELEPLPKESAGGIALVNMGPNNKGHRTAVVKASGPGYTTTQGVFIPNTVKAGDRVLVDALAGQHYALDLTIPRHNKSSEFQELFGDRGEFRIVREQEILGVLEDDEPKAAE